MTTTSFYHGWLLQAELITLWDWVPPRGCVVPGGPPSFCGSLGLILPSGGSLVMAPVRASCLLDHLLQMHLGPWGCNNLQLLILEEERKKCKKEEIIKTV